MSHAPFRFVHATNVRLDHALWGVGAVSGEARRLVEDATNLAFERILETCTQHDAAFLLLTGNTFDAAHGHRARLLLEQACERLAEQDCDVFLMPGESDPPQAWHDEVLLPENVTVFLAPDDEPVPVTRGGFTLATIEPYQDRQHSLRVPDDTGGVRVGLIGGSQQAPLQQQLAGDADGQLEIKRLEQFPSLAAFDYVALGRGSERVTVNLPRGLAHDPGCPQPLDGRQTASLGCTLIDVDRDGRLQTRLIPTAVVRREEIEIHVASEQTWDDLMAAMQAALADRDPLPTERLWLIRWIIDGEGEVIASLREPAAQEELAELVEAELADDGVLLRRHEVHWKASCSETVEIAAAGSVSEEFHALIDEHAADHLSRFRGGLPARDWPESAWVRHLIETAEEATAKNVDVHARNLARRHLLGDRPEVA